MAERIETVSFDVDVSSATKQVDAYIGTLQRLEKELITLQKEGKDTSAVQSQIASTTAQLNKALQAETTTLKGATAQTAAYQKAQTQLDATTKKAVVSTNSLTTATQKSASSFARSIGSAKNLTQSLTRGAGALSSLVGGFGISAAAVGVLSTAASAATDALYSMFIQSEELAEVQKSVEEATKAVIGEYVSEARTLNSLLAPLGDANTSTEDRKKLIAELQSQYPEYIKNINLETVNSANLAEVQKTINDRLIEGIVLRAKQGEQEKILNKIVELTIERGKVEKRVSDATAAGLGKTIGAFTGLGALAESAAVEINNVDEAYAKAQLDVKINQLAEEQKKLDETFADVATTLKSLDIDLGKNSAATDALAKNGEKAVAANKKAKEENKAAAGSLAALREELDKVNKLLTEQTQINDKQRLAELGEEYQRLTKEIEKAQAAIEEATKARKADEVQVIQNAKIGNIETELLRGRIADNQRLSEQLEIQRQRELNLIETRRQAALEATKNETARNVVNAAAAKEREAFEAQSAENILNLRIKLQKQKLDLAAREKQDTTEIAKEVLRLEAELLELTGKEYNVKIGVDSKSGEDAKKKLKRLVNEVADVVEEFSGQVFDFLSSQNQQAIATAEAAISKQQELLNGLLANEEQTNVEQVRLEQERLDKLNKAREKAKEDEARIVQAQIALNLALAVARAVVEGGAVGAAITIGIALSAAIFGFLKAKQTAQQAFYEGTMYAERAPHEPRGRDTINARLNEGEAVIPTDTTREYNKSLDAIYHGKIPAKVLNGMVGDYLSGARATREATDNAANTNRREFRILQLSKVEPAPNAPQRTTSDIKLIADLMVSELRKQPQNLLKGDKLVRMVQSKADASGKVRLRLGLK